MPLHSRITSLLTFLKSNPLIAFIVVFITLGAFGAGLKYLDEDAQRQKHLKAKERSALSRINPFLSAPPPSPTPQLSKELIYAGQRLLAVEDANANAAPPADLAVWRPPSSGSCCSTWYVLGAGYGQTTQEWGLASDKPVPGDFDGDGKTDFSVFRPSDGKWYVINSNDGSYSIAEWGLSGDTPAPADYDGDGKTDRAVFRADSPTTGNASWYIVFSSTGSGGSTPFGLTGDIPAPADYDGDGLADLGVWRPSDRKFYSKNSSNGTQHTITTGITSGTYTWFTVSADYDGDERADYGAYDKTAANWYIFKSTTSSLQTTQWQSSGDREVPNDYDGDGICDIASWRDSNGTWYIRQSASGNSLRTQQWGLSGDTPVPAYYRR